MASVSVRYIVDDVDAAIAFYCGHLGFEELMHPAPAFAMLAAATCGSCSARPGGGRAAARRCPTARSPRRAGGTGSRSRSTTSTPPSTGCAAPACTSATSRSPASAARQVLVDDPSGNPVELFQPTRAEARLG